VEYTKNLNLAKPSKNTDDIADVDVISENFQKIDDAVANIYDKLSEIEKNPSGASVPTWFKVDADVEASASIEEIKG
jgi:hypothetical protein